mmetsp:Transcript_16281/g.18334  ORF Transcript_16281/g.18334 Transcript_16281/m.18334 type:complete len:100 (+) Transcript_16281:1925-2224(+)
MYLYFPFPASCRRSPKSFSTILVNLIAKKHKEFPQLDISKRKEKQSTKQLRLKRKLFPFAVVSVGNSESSDPSECKKIPIISQTLLFFSPSILLLDRAV